MKKLIACICMLTCILSLTACGKEQKVLSEMEQAFVDTTKEMVVSLEAMPVDQLEQIVNTRNEAIAEDHETALAVKASYKSYLDSKEELGAYAPLSTDYATVEITEDETVVVIEGTFLKRTGKITAHYSWNGNLLSFSVEPLYTRAELVGQAGLNTVIGMGIVFIVLIFIAFLISLFKYINKAETYFANRKRAKEEAAFTPVDPANAPVLYEEEEELVDDLELVAVITAAVAASMNTSVDNLVVRSIKRKSTNKWSKA